MITDYIFLSYIGSQRLVPPIYIKGPCQTYQIEYMTEEDIKELPEKCNVWCGLWAV